MVGTLISGIQQFGEAIAAGINFISPDYTGVFVQGSGRLNMAIGVLCVCAPLVFINGLRQVRRTGSPLAPSALYISYTDCKDRLPWQHVSQRLTNRSGMHS